MDPASEQASAERRARWVRLFAMALVVATAAFNLWTLRGELPYNAAEPTTLYYANDSAAHLGWVRWAEHRIDASQDLDGWFPYLSLGWPQFHHYPSLPHIIGGYVSTALGSARTYALLMYLLVSLWPISVYAGARMLGLKPMAAAASALLSAFVVSFPGYGYEHSSYMWRGYGVWGQAWGMAMFPVVLGLTWQAVAKRRYVVLAAVALSILIVVHLVEAYLAFVAIAIWVVVRPERLKKTIEPAVLMTVCALLGAGWFLFPFLRDFGYAGGGEFYQNTFFLDSYGASKITGWLVSGELFDSTRFPVITIALGIGVMVCLARFRRDAASRALLVFFLGSLVLFFGPATLGRLTGFIPFAQMTLFHRFISGVHMGGLLLAGVGAAAALRAVAWLGKRLSGRRVVIGWASVAAVALFALRPAYDQVTAYAKEGADMVDTQQFDQATDGADLASLIAEIRRLGGGRAYAGMPGNWGPSYRIGQVPVYVALLHHDIDSIGFFLRVASLTADVEHRFDETNLLHYDLYNVRYVLTPDPRRPPVPATLLGRQGRHTLWKVETNGYIDVVDSTGEVRVDPASPQMGKQLTSFFTTPLLAAKRFPVVRYGDEEPGPVTAVPGGPAGAPGRVMVQDASIEQGTFYARVSMQRRGMALLKASWHPGFVATVDGERAESAMLAPGMIGVEVGPGEHTVAFRYEGPRRYPQLALGAVAFLLLWRRSRKRYVTQIA